MEVSKKGFFCGIHIFNLYLEQLKEKNALLTLFKISINIFVRNN